MKLYLAGPMTGYPRWNFDAFHEAAARLRAAGYKVVSPAEIDEALGFNPDAPVAAFTKADLHAAMRRDLGTILYSVDGVALLPGWEDSHGAGVEVTVAQAVGLDVAPIETFIQARSEPILKGSK